MTRHRQQLAASHHSVYEVWIRGQYVFSDTSAMSNPFKILRKDFLCDEAGEFEKRLIVLLLQLTL